MKDKWLNDLQKKIATHEEDAPIGLFDDIMNAVEKADCHKSPNRNNTIALWTKRIVSIAAILTITILIGYNYFSEQPPMQHLTATVKEKVNKTSRPEVETPVPNIAELNRVKSKKAINPVNKKVKKSEQQYLNPIKAQDTILVATIPHSENKESQKEEKGKNSLPQQSNNNVSRSNLKYDFENNRHISSSTRKISVNMYASNLTGSSNIRNGYGAFPSAATLYKNTPEITLLGSKPAADIFLQNQQQEIDTKIKHRLPLRAGVTFCYNITSKLGLEIGATYTNLSSEFNSGSDKYYYLGTQELHYIGIPINLNYVLWENKRFEIYLSGGGMGEKCVSGQLNTRYMLDGREESSTTEKVEIKPLQWSVKASAGVQFNIISNLGIYAEPGISYYFDNGSPIETIYKEKPLNFNLNLGVRLSFGKK